MFYHRPPRGSGFARQSMVAPIKIEYDEKSVAEGGKVIQSANEHYTKDKDRTARSSNGEEYTGAEVTSEGFHIYGLDPYQYYSAGYACYLSDIHTMQDSWDIWDNHMPITNVKNGQIIGYKYFGFGGLNQNKKGLKAFEGTKPGNNTKINLFLAPKTNKAFKINIWLDGPWGNNAWRGRRIGQITVPAGSAQTITRFVANISSVVDHLDKKHAIYLVAESNVQEILFDFAGLGFSSDKKKITYPVVPSVNITVNGKTINLPKYPVRATNANGILDYNQYETSVKLPFNATKIPIISASASSSDVKVQVSQPQSVPGAGFVKFDYKGIVKTYKIILTTK